MKDKQQCGVILIASLIILTVLTLISVTAMTQAGLQEKMANNIKDKSLAFQAADTALRRAEQFLDCQATAPTSCCLPAPPNNGEGVTKACDDITACAGGVWSNKTRNGNSVDLLERDNTWWLNTAKNYSASICTEGTGPTIGGVSQQPRYLIQELRINAGKHSYVITARGTGGTAAAEAIVQEIYTTAY